MPDSSDVRQPSPDSNSTVPESCGAAGSPAIWLGYWTDPPVLAESLTPANLTGILPEQQDSGQLARIWPGWPASGQLAKIQPFCAEFRQRLPEFVCVKYKKKIYIYIFILFYINIFLFCE
jgi:hypothetical protein